MTTQRIRPDPTELREALVWLQEQMTDVRDRMTRLQRDTDDSLGRVSELYEQINSLQERLLQQERQFETVAEIHQEAQLARESAVQLREKHSNLDLQLREIERQRGLDRDREQESRQELTHRIDEVARVALGMEGRLNVLEEAQKQIQDVMIPIGSEMVEVQDALRTMTARTENLAETGHRLEARNTLLESRLQDSERSQESLGERLHTLDGNTQRITRQLDTTVTEGLQSIAEIAEQIEVLRVERARLETRLQEFEVRTGELGGQSEEQHNQLMRLTGRAQNNDERLQQLETEIQNVSEQVVAQLVRFGQTQERQKRRQVEDLEREIRELKQHARRLAEE